SRLYHRRHGGGPVRAHGHARDRHRPHRRTLLGRGRRRPLRAALSGEGVPGRAGRGRAARSPRRPVSPAGLGGLAVRDADAGATGGAPIPEDKRHDLEYLLRLLIEIPIIYGPAKGRLRDEETVLRVLEVLTPMWNGEDVTGELTLEALSRIRQPALVLYEANSVCRAASEALCNRLPRSTSALLPGGKVKHFSGLEHPELLLEHMQAF